MSIVWNRPQKQNKKGWSMYVLPKSPYSVSVSRTVHVLHFVMNFMKRFVVGVKIHEIFDIFRVT